MTTGKKLFLQLALALTIGILSAASAFANTAAGVVISNTATLTYNGVTISSTVDVSVSLKQSAPNISITGNTATYAGVNTPSITQTVTVISTANGSSTYRVSAAVNSQSNNNDTGLVNIQGPNSYNATAILYQDVELGSTVTTGTSGQTYVTVPATSGASTASINGIVVGDKIIIRNDSNTNTYERTVTEIADQGDGTYRIKWAAADSIPVADVPASGIVVGEKKVLNFYAYPGIVQTSGVNIVITVHATAANTVDGNTVSITTNTPATNTWDTAAPTVVFTKYVRNVTQSVTGNGGSADVTFGGNTYTYYRSGVTAKPGDTLEYLIVAQNTDATLSLTGCAVGDALPIGSYASFRNNAYGTNQDIAYFNNTATASYLQAFNAAPNQATLIGSTLNVKVGAGANATTAGSVSPGATVKILYQLTVK